MDISQRQCESCKDIKILSSEFFIPRKKKDKVYFGYKCRLCENKDCKKYHQQNKEDRLSKMRNWKDRNKSHVKKYRDEHKNEAKQYRQDNKERYREYFKNRQRELLKNPIYRIHSNMSKSINEQLKRNKLNKNNKSWIKYVDYSVEELKIHLENKFREGMSWDNYGEWHIDHIKPKSLFNITDVNSNEFKECWSLNNLQPLWAADNCAKGNRFIG